VPVAAAPAAPEPAAPEPAESDINTAPISLPSPEEVAAREAAEAERDAAAAREADTPAPAFARTPSQRQAAALSGSLASEPEPLEADPVPDPVEAEPVEAPPLRKTGLARWWPALLVLVLVGGGGAVVALSGGDSGDAAGEAGAGDAGAGAPEAHRDAKTQASSSGGEIELQELPGEAGADSDAGAPAEAPEPKKKTHQPKPAKTEGAKAKPALDCGGVEASAEAAKKSRDWATVIRETAKRKCWSSNQERLRLRVEALAQAKRFSECLETANKAKDPQLERWVKFCSKNL
jgi:hypothetical protein